MSNMSYCRFRNTKNDLRDCLNALTDNDLSREEHRARAILVELCHDIAEQLTKEEALELPYEKE